MHQLELRVPPVLVVVIFGAAMWAVSIVTPGLHVARTPRLLIATALGVLGLAIAMAGVAEFRRAQTTVDPTNPGKSSSVVTGGIYRFTRNPMYLGFLLVIVGWAVYLASPWSLGGPVLFVLYMNRFQIRPEERILAARFGAPFEQYLGTVRRWI